MAAAKKGPAQNPALQILPLPEIVREHHRVVLERPMRQWQETLKVPPVLLLTGPSGVGKRSVAHFLAQWLLCERAGFQSPTAGSESEEELGGGLFGDSPGLGFDPEPAQPSESASADGPCGSCPSCQRALSGNWVDFTEISSESEEDSPGTGTLKIEQFRKLKETLGFGSYSGGYRITLIREADRMTIQAANSLLKLLEEPPAGWVFLLTASDSSNLLPTIVSRCQILRLRPFTTADLESLLARDSSLSDEKRRACAALAQGSWGKAHRLASGDAWEKRQELMRFLEAPENELSALVDWAAAEPQNLQLLLDHLEQALAELLRWSVSPDPSALSHRALQEHAGVAQKSRGGPEGARSFWNERAQRVFRARSESLTPVNKKLLVQDLLLPFCGR